MIEIACPESCHYLTEAREQTAKREGDLRLKEMMVAGKPPQMLSELSMDMISLIYGSIVNAQRNPEGVPTRDLKDEEILEAVDLVFKNFRTEESGLIYQHMSPSARVDKVSRSIRTMIDNMVGQDTQEGPVTRNATIKALEFVRGELEAHIKRADGNPSSRNFLLYIALFVPWPKAAFEPRIIVS